MQPRRLNDQQMQRFLRTGYVVVKPELSAEFHDSIFQQAETVWETEFNPGNNLLPRIPELRRVFDDPEVSGVLTSVLGANYYLWPHRHCHYNAPGTPAQQMHKDAGSHKSHRSRRLFALYYPQGTTLDMGPTAVLSGSAIYNTRPSDDPDDEIPVTVEAGSVAIANYDIWHRATENRSERKRYMMKFLFTRMEEPTQPSWDSQQVDWPMSDDERHRELWSRLWHWHRGNQNGDQRGSAAPAAAAITRLVAALDDESEAVGIDAAYKLGEMGAPAVPALIEALQAADGPASGSRDVQAAKLGKVSRSELTRRNVSYGLSAVGAAAVPALVAAAAHRDWWVRAAALESLGDIGLGAAAAIPALIEALRDECEAVCGAAAEALGTISQAGATAVPALTRALTHNGPGVRRTTTLALARIGRHATAAVPGLQAVLDDDDRYVRGQAVQALYRIGSAAAREVLVDYLLTRRWCNLTTKESLF